MNITRTIAILSICAVGITSASAASYTTKNDLNRRPVDQIAAELGVEGQQFADCFVKVRPAKDFNPTPERERANKAVLLSCLQEANADITNDHLDSVMNKYRGQHVANR